MSNPPQPAERCPDLLFLAPSHTGLTVVALLSRFGRESVAWRERLAPPGGADSPRLLGERLRELMTHRAIRPKTPIVLIAPPTVGGFLPLPAAQGVDRDREWVARQLSLQLPFAAEDLVWRTLAQPSGLEVYWLPRAWIKALSEAFERLGLSLLAVLPRTALLRPTDIALPWCIRREDDGCVHVFRHGTALRSLCLPVDAEAEDQRLALELAALGAEEQRVEPWSATPAAETAALLAAWQRGNEAIDLQPGRWGVWEPVWRLGLAIGFLALVAVSLIQFQKATQQEAIEDQARDHRKALEVRKKVMLLEKELRREQRLLDELAMIDASPTPLEMLAKVTEALPDGLWLHGLRFVDGRIELRGAGGEGERVVELLAAKSVAATVIAVPEPPLADDGFAVAIALPPEQVAPSPQER